MSVKRGQLRNEYYMTSLEENIASDDIVRVIDEIVEQLDLKKLGFVEKERKNNAGNSNYSNKDMLKLFIYGYRRGIRSGRKLEDINRYDMRFQWLLKKLTPDANTINDYRKEHIEAMEKVFYEVNRIYIELGILKLGTYSQDGFKIRAVNSKEKNYTKNKIMDRMKREKKSIEEREIEIKTLEEEQEKVKKYFEDMRIEEEKEAAEEELKKIEKRIEEAREELEEIEKRKEQHEAMIEKMKEEKTTQISLTDPESKLMKNNGKYEVCYNNQVGVDVETHLTIGYETDNNPADVGSLSSLGEKLKREYGEEGIQTNITDKGYQNKRDMMLCMENGIIPQVTQNDKKKESIELETEYEEAEISEEEKKSTKREDIRKCIRAGVIPDCYKEVIEKIEIKEVRKYTKKVEAKAEEEEESSEAIRERAMREQKFIKDKNLGCVVCPMGEYLNAKSKRPNGNIRYANKLACKCCKNPCTKSKYKEVEMSEEKKEIIPKGSIIEKPRESILKGQKKESIKKKKVILTMKIDKELQKKRMATSEHSQGTMKNVDNFSSYHLKGKVKASGEIALHFLASNIRRAANIKGPEELLKELKERRKRIENNGQKSLIFDYFRSILLKTVKKC